MSKKITWLEQFANSYNEELQKTASKVKIADQIIVDCSAYPDVKVGSFVDYKDNKYKVVDTEFRDSAGPGIVLEKLAEGEEMPEDVATDMPVDGGEVEASIEEPDEKECGDGSDCMDVEKTAGLDDVTADPIEQAVDAILDTGNEYPSTVEQPGGVKPAPSAPLGKPGQKRLTDAPYHPTFDPGEQYAMDCPDDFQDAADRTADVINQEDAQDRTTVDGHYTWNQNIIINNIINDPDYAIDETPVEETFVEEDLPALEDEPAEEELPEIEDENTVSDDVDQAVDELLGDMPEDVPADDDASEDIPEELPEVEEEEDKKEASKKTAKQVTKKKTTYASRLVRKLK